MFLADDSLGWVYQFWQSEEKDESTSLETKIGADELPAVTQLFTEDYMVEFLLHNTLGAWWAAKLGPMRAADRTGSRAAVAARSTGASRDDLGPYLQIHPDGSRKLGHLPQARSTVAEGGEELLSCSIPAWAVAISSSLPCRSWRMRMEEEGLYDCAVDFMPRCKTTCSVWKSTHVAPRFAAFNLALTAWKQVVSCHLPPLTSRAPVLPHAPQNRSGLVAGW